MECVEFKDILSNSFFNDWFCKKIERDIETYQLTTTFLYPNSDCIELVIEAYGDDIVITDNGNTYLFLISHGYELKKERVPILNSIANQHGLDYLDHEFIVRASRSDFSLKLNLITNAIQEASSLVHLVREYSRSDFKKTVVNTFKMLKAKVYEDYLVKGYKMDHVIDVRLNGQDEVLSKTISETEKYKIQVHIERTWYAFNDIQKTDRKFKPIIIYDDSTEEHENAWSEHHFDQLSAEGISAIGISANRNDINQLAYAHR